MVVQAQQTKRDEQYPLLKADCGAGEPSLPQPLISVGRNVTCVSKRSWHDRWPELISACWMTLILLGITFLVFYALGMSAFRRQSLLIVRCNTSTPAKNVHFHHLIPREGDLLFPIYSDYLSSIARKYPLLHINVLFLIDDTLHKPMYRSKQSIVLTGPRPSNNDDYTTSINVRDEHEIKIFQQRYRNINITIIPVSQYMAMTPLRYKWKMIPKVYLLFYARVFAVWEYGGIGLDLTTFNNQYNNNQMPDRRITAILEQHNDGIEDKRYIQTLNNINREEQTEFLNLFYNMVTSIFNNTYSFFDTPFFNEQPPTEVNHYTATKSRNYRNKRENSEIIENNKTDTKGFRQVAIDNINNIKILKEVENELNATNKNLTSGNTREGNNSSLIKSNIHENSTSTLQGELKNNNNGFVEKLNVTKTGIEIPHIALFYDFSVFSDGIGPSYFLPDAIQLPNPTFKNNVPRTSSKQINTPSYLLSITYDGTFVAATTRHHPFLGHLLTSGCKTVNPKFSIENTMFSQCSGFLRNDVYCTNIYLLD